MISRILSRLGSKSWSSADILKYVGPFSRSYLAYATDPGFRANAASGGSTSAILCALLSTGEIDGALVLKTTIEEGALQTRFTIATTPEEVLEAQGSKYMAVFFHRDAVPLIRAFPGNLGVVALPCDLKLLLRLRRADPDLDRRIKLTIGLVCGHNSERALIDKVIERISAGRGALRRFTFRSGHWRGRMKLEFADGSTEERPFSEFSVYQNLYFFSQRKCHHCDDHFGYHADLSAGDIWLYDLRDHPIKHNSLITHTPAAAQAIQAARDEGFLTVEDVAIEKILDGQSRTLPFHHNIQARHIAGKRIGVRVRDQGERRPRPLELLLAYLALGNEKLSRSETGRRFIFSLPRPVLRLYLYFFKFLETI